MTKQISTSNFEYSVKMWNLSTNADLNDSILFSNFSLLINIKYKIIFESSTLIVPARINSTNFKYDSHFLTLKVSRLAIISFKHLILLIQHVFNCLMGTREGKYSSFRFNSLIFETFITKVVMTPL
jgi:hypothetical protein